MLCTISTYSEIALGKKTINLEVEKKATRTSLQTDVYGRSAMPNCTLSFEMCVGQW